MSDGKIRPAKPPPDTSWLRTAEVRDGDRRREGQERDEKPGLADEYFDPALLDGHGWVKRAAGGPDHTCSPPMESFVVGANERPIRSTFVIGDLGDLWRCWCDRLWRVGVRFNGNGGCRVAWFPAHWWQRLWYRGRP